VTIAQQYDLPLLTVCPADDPPPGVPADVAGLFERLALDVAGRGFDRYSARALAHRIRWHERVDRGNREFVFNNNWTPALARWVMSRHEKLAGFFETRTRRNDADGADS
jgi:hypothetical protein